MSVANDLLEPELLYKRQLKDQFHQNAEDYFNNLLKEAGTDKELNDITCDKIYKNQEISRNNQSQRNSKRGWLTTLLVFGIIFIVVGVIVSLMAAFDYFDYVPMWALAISINIFILGLLAIILPHIFIKPKIKALDEIIAKLEEEIKQDKQLAWEQMASLNHSFDWGIAAELMNKTTPLIEMDKNFNPERFYKLHEKYGFQENVDKDISSIYVQSGQILGNPFLMQRNFCTYMTDYTYTGSITISWTTTYHDKNGVHYQTHTQVLTASVTKPKPMYFKDTWLVYGNDAAERLSFSRQPNKASNMNEKDLAKFVKKTEKELTEMHEQQIATSNFTPLANSEFEGLFHAYDRDNETQFRLLFTPLAQKSMLALLKNQEPYGDDFIFRKRKCLNYIKSRHSQLADYDGNPANFMHFDNRISQQLFIKYMDNFFQGFFFDLAPLLCIPIYQQHKSKEFIYKDVYERNVTSYETEVMANQFDPKQFAPAECKTDIILKSELIKKEGQADIVNIHAYGYDRERHVTYISKMGGDGRMHEVPVEWYEYIPCEKTTPMEIQNISYTKKTYEQNLEKLRAFLSPHVLQNAIISQRGIFSSVLYSATDAYNGQELNNIVSHKEE